VWHNCILEILQTRKKPDDLGPTGPFLLPGAGACMESAPSWRLWRRRIWISDEGFHFLCLNFQVELLRDYKWLTQLKVVLWPPQFPWFHGTPYHFSQRYPSPLCGLWYNLFSSLLNWSSPFVFHNQNIHSPSSCKKLVWSTTLVLDRCPEPRGQRAIWTWLCEYMFLHTQSAPQSSPPRPLLPPVLPVPAHPAVEQG
jgi:hypothetical protein